MSPETIGFQNRFFQVKVKQLEQQVLRERRHETVKFMLLSCFCSVTGHIYMRSRVFSPKRQVRATL